MTKKQEKALKKIIISAIVFLAVMIARLSFPTWENYIELLLLIPYYIVGIDVLKAAWKGLCNREVFDENFLMAVATITIPALGTSGGPYYRWEDLREYLLGLVAAIPEDNLVTDRDKTEKTGVS